MLGTFKYPTPDTWPPCQWTGLYSFWNCLTIHEFFISNFLTLSSFAGSVGEEELKKKPTSEVKECFESVNRGIFAFNQAIDGLIFEPLAKGYLHLPSPIRTGTSNFVGNLSTLLTIPNNILKLSSKYLNDPVRISVGESNTVAKNITQEIIELKSDEKLDELINQITNRNGSILIFVKTKYGTEKLSKALSRSKIKSFPLHGGLRQSKRNTIMKNFRDMKFRILIATDVAARGIDVPHICLLYTSPSPRD